MEAVSRTGNELLVRVHVQPNASRSEITGFHGDRLKMRVRAKPVEGEANAAGRKFLAKLAGVAVSQVELVRGATSREKDFKVLCKSEKEADDKQNHLTSIAMESNKEKN